MSVTVRIEKGEAGFYQELVQVFKNLRELCRYCSDDALQYLNRELTNLLAKEKEALSIKRLLCNHATGVSVLSPEEIVRLNKRRHELLSYPK